MPQITFSDQMTIELGATMLELSYVGRNHSDNSIVMRFPKERVLFAVDFIPVESVAFRDFPDAYVGDGTLGDTGAGHAGRPSWLGRTPS